MRLFIAACFATALTVFAGAALAQDAMDVTYGNTVTVSDAEGTLLASYFFESDGTFAMTTAAGDSAAGTWATNDAGELCMTMGEDTGCNPLDGNRSVGDSWEDTDADGNTLTIAIVAGR